jgi:hypothetical protein
MPLPKKVVFCLPGNSFSSNFFNSWNVMIAELNKLGIQYAYSNDYNPVVYYTRNRILGGNNTSGKMQKPWQSQLPYDKMVWIDNDIVWTPENVINLLSHDYPIVSGVYIMEDKKHYPVVENLEFDKLYQNGVFDFISRPDMQSRIQPFKVSYTGFGFISISNGVLESMEYPWFKPRWISNENFHDFSAEDVGFCWSAKEAGHEIWVDPTIHVGHEKRIILR